MPIKPHKLAIIGAGKVGDAVLSNAMGSGLFAEVVVLDVNQDMARDLERLSADPAFFKPWLKEGREAMRKAQRAERGYSDLDDYY